MLTVPVVAVAGTGAPVAAVPQVPAQPAATPTTTAPPTTTATAPGPTLVDSSGRTVDARIARVAQRVHTDLEQDDLDSLAHEFSASGSDNWLTSGPHLVSGPVRTGVLAALRTRPAHEADGSYSYARNGFTVVFGQGDQSARPGLLSINCPWDGSSASNCAAGTLPVATDGMPCMDPATGMGVHEDGTIGLHGLRPCPPGTPRPTDPDAATRNPATGEICALG